MYKRYGFIGCFKLILSIIFTRICYPRARLIRIPFDIRNRHLIKLGKGFTTGFGCRIEAHPIDSSNDQLCISFGENVQLNDYVHIAAGLSVTIGDNVLIASKVFISDLNHGSYTSQLSDSPLTIPALRKLSAKPVVIGKNVWLGESVCILPGVNIGEGSIIGSLSVVTKDIPAFSIAVGAPAKVIKRYDFESQIWTPIK